MKTFISQFLRATFLVFYALALFKAKICLAQSPKAPFLPAGSEAYLPDVQLPELNFSVKAPPGWKVRQFYRGKSLVFEDPLASREGEFEFHRQLTISVSSPARPIDETELARLALKLKRETTEDRFQIEEARLVPHSGKEALWVSASYRSKDGHAMRAVFLLLSGTERSALLHFQDLQSVYDREGSLDRVWASMQSATLEGEAPRRYEGFMMASSSLALLAFASYLSKSLVTKADRARLLDAQLRKVHPFIPDDFDRRQILPPLPWADERRKATA